MKTFLKFILGQKIINSINLLIFRADLNKLAQIYNTDKFGRHSYTSVYMEFFKKIRKNKLKIFEIGVGGYDSPSHGGASLKMWKKYFYKSHIYAIDIYDKSGLNEDRITIFKGSQINSPFLNDILENIGKFDIIIDDGSHINEHVIFSFNFLFLTLVWIT